MLVPRIRFDRSSQPSKSWKIQASRGNEKNGLKIYSLECFTRSNLANMLGSTIGGFVALLVGLTAFLRLIVVSIASIAFCEVEGIKFLQLVKVPGFVHVIDSSAVELLK